MKFRAIKFPGSPSWHVQLSERPPILLDTVSTTLEGQEIFYLRKPYASAADAEEQIKSLARDWKLEAGEWQ